MKKDIQVDRTVNCPKQPPKRASIESDNSSDEEWLPLTGKPENNHKKFKAFNNPGNNITFLLLDHNICAFRQVHFQVRGIHNRIYLAQLYFQYLSQRKQGTRKNLRIPSQTLRYIIHAFALFVYKVSYRGDCVPLIKARADFHFFTGRVEKF